MFKLVGMSSNPGYRIVKLASGAHSVHSLAHHETFHPVVGPVVEAESLYVRQLNLAERFQSQQDEFVIWDVGLGARPTRSPFCERCTEYLGRFTW